MGIRQKLEIETRFNHLRGLFIEFFTTNECWGDEHFYTVQIEAIERYWTDYILVNDLDEPKLIVKKWQELKDELYKSYLQDLNAALVCEPSYPDELSLGEIFYSFRNLLKETIEEFSDQLVAINLQLIPRKVKEIKLQNEDCPSEPTHHISNEDHLQLDQVRHKIVLLYELGVIEHIERVYPITQVSIGGVSEIIRTILGLPKDSLETIRKDLENLRNPKKRSDTITKTAANKVKKELAKINITNFHKI